MLNRSVRVFRVSFHKVCTSQELICRIHTLEILAGNTHKSGQTRARTDKDCFKTLLKKLVNSNCSSDNGISVYSYAQRFKTVYLFLNDSLWQTELGNTVHQNSSRKVQSFKYGHLIAEACKISCTGKTCRSRADNSSLVTVRLRLFGFGCTVLVVPIGNETLQSADAYGIALDTADALSLALGLLRTYPSAYCGQRA